MSKLTYLLQTAGLAFVLAALMAPVIIKKLRELKFGQKILEDGPTWHKGKQNTPTMGGVIFIAAMTLAVLTTLPAMASAHDYRALVMLGLSLVFGGIGMIDDWTKIRKKRNKGLTALQKLLLQAGYTLPKYGADGDFGDECLNAVKAFQRDNKLTVDGIVGAKTWEALLNGKNIARSYKIIINDVNEAAKNKIVEYLDNAKITAVVQEV